MSGPVGVCGSRKASGSGHHVDVWHAHFCRRGVLLCLQGTSDGHHPHAYLDFWPSYICPRPTMMDSYCPIATLPAFLQLLSS